MDPTPFSMFLRESAEFQSMNCYNKETVGNLSLRSTLELADSVHNALLIEFRTSDVQLQEAFVLTNLQLLYCTVLYILYIASPPVTSGLIFKLVSRSLRI